MTVTIELPIRKTAHDAFMERFVEGKGMQFFTFKLNLEGHDDKLFLIAHGTPDGSIKLGDYAYTPEYVLKHMIASGIKDKGIKEVCTLSCYGGLQTPATVDGITISSAHDCIEEIGISVGMDMGDNYFMTVTGVGL